jgi:hypothetical protein
MKGAIEGRISIKMLIKWVLLMFLIIFFIGCSVESKLNRNYKGKSFALVMDRMGAPTNIEQMVGGGTIRSYVKKTMLKETPINTGQFQYDTFNSPKVLKSEITQFFVNQDGKVLEIKYSCEYSR